MNGRGQVRRARPGAAAPPSARPLPAWPPLPFVPAVSPRWRQNNNRKDQRGGRSSGRRAGVLSLLRPPDNHEIEIRNRPAPRAGRSPAGERGQSLYRYWFNSLQWAREIIFCVVRTPKADRGWSEATPQCGRVRPVWGRPAGQRGC